MLCSVMEPTLTPEDGIEAMEDYYLAADVLERVRKGEEAVHSLDEVERDLGLAD